MGRVWETTPPASDMQRLRSRKLVVSISGGKDSTAVGLYCKRLGLDFDLVHMNTGWETRDTERYILERIPEILGRPVHILVKYPKLDAEREAIALKCEAMLVDSLGPSLHGDNRSAMVRWILNRAMFPSRTKRYCTQELKIFPFLSWMKQNTPDDGSGAVNAVGVRAQESAARSGLPQWEMDDAGYLVWRPLIDWTERDVIDFHLSSDVGPNPLYLEGAGRVGCFPCIHASKHQIRYVSEREPVRIAVIRLLEFEVTRMAKRRALDRGDTFTRQDGRKKFRAFFSNPIYRKEYRRRLREAHDLGLETDAAATWAKDRTRAQLPIDEVLAWTRTRRGSDEVEGLAPPPHATGCTRWGFCDLSWRSGGADDSKQQQRDLFAVDGKP